MRDSNNLRLRLVVRRHALPEVRVVFALQLDNDPTIADLLEQVNEIIPLESNDWGLEDYAVELRDSGGRAFDCLHFQQVSVILKNDEELFIRPLDTGDRRKRRLSGRHQISADGKHLIDGIAFGRPRLKPPRDRPPVEIPPLKRRRITYEAEENEDEGEEPQLLTEHGEGEPESWRVRPRARFHDTDGNNLDDEDDDFVNEDSDGDSDEGDDDLDEDDVGDSDLQDELRLLRADNEQLPGEMSDEPAARDAADQPAVHNGDKRLDLETLDKISALRRAFPTVSFDLCEQTLLLHEGDVETAYSTLRTQHHPLVSLDSMLAYANTLRVSEAVEDDDSADSEAESVSSVVKHYDNHGFPPGSILAGTASAQAAETMRQAGRPVKVPVHTKFDEEPSMLADSARSAVSSDEDGSESGSESGSDSDSDSGPEIASSKMREVSAGARLSNSERSSVSSSSGSESESESNGDDGDSSGDSDDSDSSDGSSPASTDDESDDESDDDSYGEAGASLDSSDSASGSHEAASSSDDDSVNDASSIGGPSGPSSAPPEAMSTPAASGPSATMQSPFPEQRPVQQSNLEELTSRPTKPEPPPGQGKPATQRRNSRRKTARRAQKAAAKDEPGPGPSEHSNVSLATASASCGELVAAKKAVLLATLNFLEEVRSWESPGTASKDQGKETTPTVTPPRNGLVSDKSSAPDHEPPASVSSQGKLRLDIGAGRRMVFGALGLKAPKTKADEDRLRSTLSHGIEPLVNHRLLESNSCDLHASKDETAADEDPEAWRHKIIYRAVECCHDGIELSEPPFPFVQRWDPQQQYLPNNRNQRGGRSKRKQRNHPDFVGEENRSRAKRRKYAEDAVSYDAEKDIDAQYASQGHGYIDGDKLPGEDIVLNYDDEPHETQKQTGQAFQQSVDEDDLPPLPADVSALPALQSGQATPGMILTWKQWLLSKATSWQPQVSDLTGVVVDVPDDSTLRVRLAKRDWNRDRNEKLYDDDGNRVYDKFELPGMDEEDEEAAEEGYRTLNLADMIEPRILRPPSEAVGYESCTQQPLGSNNHSPVPQGIQQDAIQSSQELASADQDEAERTHIGSQQMEMATQHVGQSVVSEASLPHGQADDVSMSEDRRHEISLLINDAGFRKDIDPAVDNNAPLDLSSPSRQLEEMIHEALPVTSQVSQSQNQANPESPSQMTSNNIDSQPILLEPFQGFSDAVSETPEHGQVAYPKLCVPPSDTGSVHSGHQVDPDFSIELGHDSFHGAEDDADAPDSALRQSSDSERGRACVAGSKRDGDPGSESDSESSDASFPSLSEIWITASTNRSKSPGKAAVVSAIKARKSNVKPDPEYEEAMRRLDDSDELSKDGHEDRQRRLSESTQTLVDKPIEKPPAKTPAQQKAGPKQLMAPHIKSEHASSRPTTVDPELHPRRTNSGTSARQPNSSFVVPEGSQVVSLLTSSPEPEVEENYADDSIDETYKEEQSMPTGSGWVKKSSRGRRGLLGVQASLAAGGRDAVPRRFASSSQPKPTSVDSLRGGSSAALGSLLRAKKKVFSSSLKF